MVLPFYFIFEYITSTVKPSMQFTPNFLGKYQNNTNVKSLNNRYTKWYAEKTKGRGARQLK